MVLVTADNFARAETDRYFSDAVKRGGLGTLYHYRTLMPIDNQTVIRANRDTLYSSGVFDLAASPVTITLPETDGRFRSLQVIDEDQYTRAVVYDAGRCIFTREAIGTRYLLLAIRILVDPRDPRDLELVHALQDATVVEQSKVGRFEVPDWDAATQTMVRDALLTLAETLPDTKRMFGTREQVDPVRRLIGSASAWGGNPDKDAMYLNVVPEQNDGTRIHRLTVKDVLVDGFWSISVYNAKGYFEPNPRNAYTLNSVTAKNDADGSITIQFGGCGEGVENCLPIMDGWNYMVRLYRPRAQLLEGRWRFPRALPIPTRATSQATLARA